MLLGEWVQESRKELFQVRYVRVLTNACIDVPHRALYKRATHGAVVGLYIWGLLRVVLQSALLFNCYAKQKLMYNFSSRVLHTL